MPRTWRGAAGAALCASLAAVLLAAGCGRGVTPPADAASGVQPPHPAPVSRTDLADRIRADGPTSRTGHAICQVYLVPVLPAPAHGTAQPDLLWTRMCAERGFTGHDVQVLLPGAGYDHHYYDWPDPRLNYVAAATASSTHPVTVEVDLLGTGHSTHPDGTQLTIPTQAYIISQLIFDLREDLFGASFNHLILVGHSVGGYIAWTTAAHYAGVDGLVLLDALHSRTPAAAALAASQHDAGTDPRYARLAWAATGYKAVAAGKRCGIFYYQPGTYPGTCTQDERINATTATPVGELGSIAAAVADRATTGIHVPVLLAVGDHDQLFDTNPTAVHAECGAWYPKAVKAGGTASCGAVFEAQAGHDTNLHRGARDLYAKIAGWERMEVDA